MTSEAETETDEREATGGTGDGQPESWKPAVPTYKEMQALRRARNRRGGDPSTSIRVELAFVTPILGGSYRTRAIDHVDIIRPATLRGQLRFWWRALYAGRYNTPQQLYEGESRLWGCAATEEGGRSAIELRVTVLESGEEDTAPIQLYDKREARETKGSYALWPAKDQDADPQRGREYVPTAPRRAAGTRFRLDLRVPKDVESEIRSVLRAWLIFGGYGGRTRRGLGSPTVTSERGAWLPRAATLEGFRELFGRDVFAALSSAVQETPQLAGAALYVGNATTNAETAWTTALSWLKAFRQGTGGTPGGRARESGAGKPEPNRPSISNWPEPDKIRHLRGRTTGHAPRHNDTPAWPRAGFGLPIIGQFQTRARDGGNVEEPPPFELRWRDERGEHDRLASPLVLGPIPLADGRFVPAALWLNRAMPPGAEAGLARPRAGGSRNEREVDPPSAAPFDRLVAPADTARFGALAGKASLRDAFLDWLAAQGAKEVAR